VSEGRDRRVVDDIARAYASSGARVVDTHADPDHHRAVHTLLGDDDRLIEALVAGIAVARDLIDLRRHDGIHPRIGAADVVPLVPLVASDMPRARAAAEALGERVGRELGLPVFLYGESGGGRRPAFFRRGGPAELQRRIDSGELSPDFGPAVLDERAGGVLIGARAPLAAFNLLLDTDDATIAGEIARAVRASGGGLPGVQAIGLLLGSSGRAQVSMNVIDLDAAPLHRVVERVVAEAVQHGVEVLEGELVGLVFARVVVGAARAAGVETEAGADGVPGAAALAAAARLLRLPELSADRVVESHLL
jgi:glutamate formiminotransferase